MNSPYPGQAVRADDWVGMFGGRNHQFYFAVPTGVKEINIDVAGTLREPVSAQLISPDGKVVTEVKMLEGMKRLHHNREKADASRDLVPEISLRQRRFQIPGRRSASAAGVIRSRISVEAVVFSNSEFVMPAGNEERNPGRHFCFRNMDFCRRRDILLS